jgi:hypothetical protein
MENHDYFWEKELPAKCVVLERNFLIGCARTAKEISPSSAIRTVFPDMCSQGLGFYLASVTHYGRDMGDTPCFPEDSSSLTE